MKFIREIVMAATTVATTQTTNPVTTSGVRSFEVGAEITDTTPADFTFTSGTAEVQTFTFPAKAGATDGDYIEFFDASGTAWAVALDVDGVAAGAPTGAIWTAVAAARKSNCDISATTTAASVAAAVELCVDALTGVTAVIVTDDSAANGTMTFTQVESGNATTAVPKNTDDTGAGSITQATTTPGVAGNVSVSGDLITAADHGMTTGGKITALTTDGSLPTGISGATAYYPIVVSTSTFKLATSQANALAGTNVNITAIGSGTQTVDVAATIAGTMKLQKNVESSDGTDLWIDVPSSSTTIDDADDLSWSLSNVAYSEVRGVLTITSGEISATVYANGKD